MTSSHARLHGVIPPAGVWHREGQALLEHKNMNIGKNLISTGADLSFIGTNTFYRNGMDDDAWGAQQNLSSRQVHLGPQAVPLFDEPSSPLGRLPARAPNKNNQMSPLGKASKMSALEFDDSRATEHRAPQRTAVDGAWRLNTSLSESKLPFQYSGGTLKRVIQVYTSQEQPTSFSCPLHRYTYHHALA